MPKLSNVFTELLKNKSKYLSTDKGKDFEDKIHSCLHDYGFALLSKKDDKVVYDFLQEIKPIIQNPRCSDMLKNTLKNHGNQYVNRYIVEPYGGNDFPDILVLTEEYIIIIETKFTKDKTTHPVWNNNLPKANTIYIFGAYGLRDLTIFKGSDVLPENERDILLNFFEDSMLQKWIDNFESSLKSQFDQGTVKFERGFFIYPRRNFNQKKNINPNAETDYFKAKTRKLYEQNVINFLKALEKDA